VGRVLHDGYLRAAEVIQGNEAQRGRLDGAHVPMFSHPGLRCEEQRGSAGALWGDGGLVAQRE
jgi:hypothetical protein